MSIIGTYDLLQMLRINKHKAQLLDYSGAVDWVFDICCQFIVSAPVDDLRNAIHPYDPANALEVIQGQFAKAYEGLVEKFAFAGTDFIATSFDYYTLALEMLVTGLVSIAPPPYDAPCSLPAFRKYRYQVGLKALGILQDDAEGQWAQLETEAQKQYQNVCSKIQDFTEHKQSEPDLAPAEKARVLLNALKARNARGWLKMERTGEAVTGDIDVLFSTTPHLSFTPGIQKSAETIFDQYRSLTVATLMEMLEYCVDIYLEDFQEKGFNPVWHAKRGKDVSFFFLNIVKIANQIDQAKQTNFLSYFT